MPYSIGTRPRSQLRSRRKRRTPAVRGHVDSNLNAFSALSAIFSLTKKMAVLVSPRPGATDREPAKPTKKHCNGFTRHLSLDLADPRVDGRLVSSEAWAVPPDPCDWDSSAAVAAAAGCGWVGLLIRRGYAAAARNKSVALEEEAALASQERARGAERIVELEGQSQSDKLAEESAKRGRATAHELPARILRPWAGTAGRWGAKTAGAEELRGGGAEGLRG